eukprot:15329363-Ditylum_brightwellii.AAC.1
MDKSLYNLTNLEDIKRFSSHSIRVGACVLLHSSGKDGDFIKLRLHWKSDTCRLYLRNTTLLSAQHCLAVSNILDTAQTFGICYSSADCDLVYMLLSQSHRWERGERHLFVTR